MRVGDAVPLRCTRHVSARNEVAAHLVRCCCHEGMVWLWRWWSPGNLEGASYIYNRPFELTCCPHHPSGQARLSELAGETQESEGVVWGWTSTRPAPTAKEATSAWPGNTSLGGPPSAGCNLNTCPRTRWPHTNALQVSALTTTPKPNSHYPPPKHTNSCHPCPTKSSCSPLLSPTDAGQRGGPPQGYQGSSALARAPSWLPASTPAGGGAPPPPQPTQSHSLSGLEGREGAGPISSRGRRQECLSRRCWAARC